MINLPPGPVTPEALCRHVLATVRQRLQGDHELSYLEMLLTYFVDVAPSPPEFTARLQRYVADGRPGICEAATTLLETWQRSQERGQPLSLPLPELMRTLGGTLDAEPAETVVCEVRADGVTVRRQALMSEQRLDVPALQREATARRALRGQGPGAAAVPLGYEVLLRLVGLDLETQPAQTYTVVVTAQLVAVTGSAGYQAVYSIADLATRAGKAKRQRSS
ncbi:MAG TPA: hypothetical protein VII06_40265 [Chloroflexota bacterium]|jgi:hypothetical protein